MSESILLKKISAEGIAYLTEQFKKLGLQPG